MARNPNKSEVAFRPDDIVQGERPSVGEWQAEGTRFRHVAESLDVTGLIRETVADMRSQVSIFGLNRNVKSLANPEFPFSLYVTGSGQTVATGSSATAHMLANLLEHAMGGMLITPTLAANGTHSNTTIEFTDSTGMAVGALVAIEDDNGECHVREITDIAADVITLDEALPFVPQDGDLVRSTITLYVDEAVLEDSAAGPYTGAFFIRKGGETSPERWEVLGCKAQANTINLPRGDLPTVDFTVMGSGLVGPNAASAPAWSGVPDGLAPTSIGQRTDVFLQDVGNTAQNGVCVNEVGIDLGIPAIRSEVVTETHENMEGTCSFGSGPADTTITVNVVPFDEDFWDDFDDDTDKVFRWTKRGAPGNVFAIHAPLCEIAANPERGANEAHSTSQMTLRARPRETGPTSALWRSKIKIAIA